MKKKLLSLLVAVCMFIPCLFMLTACGNSVVGKYSISTVSQGEITWSKADYEEKAESEDLTEEEQFFAMMAGMFFASDMTIELKDNNKFVMTATIEEETQTTEGSWSKDGDKITLSINAEGEDEEAEIQEVTVKDGKLVMTEGEGEEVITITLAKN